MARNVIVTGGGTGIGYATAAWFVAAGDAVTITGRRENVLADAAITLGANYVQCDGVAPDSVEAAVATLPDRIDVLVNNAGGNTDFDNAEPADLAGIAANWLANLNGNVLSAVLMTEALAARFAENARIVTIGSIAARFGGGSYGAAKAAIEAWNRGIAGRFGTNGITANVVAPGLIEDTEFFRDQLSAERRHTLINATATKRPGAPDDVAGTIGFLASPAARHITGQVVHLNGGAAMV